MISQDDVLTAVWSDLDGDTALRSLLGDSGRIVKGPKRPDGLTNPCVTVHMPVRAQGTGWHGANRLLRTTTDPVLIAVFADNVDNGAMDVPLLSTICARVHSITADSKPSISGAAVHRIGQLSESGPLFDRTEPHEAYTIMSFGYWISESF